MSYLLDTGILLRLFHRVDPAFPAIHECVRRLQIQPQRPFVAMQNLAEFWNVTTRPISARGGYGASISAAQKRLRLLESLCTVLYPTKRSLADWKELLVNHKVSGVQVHDAHLAAVMRAAGISHIVTLNGADFIRFPDITAISPDELLTQLPASSS